MERISKDDTSLGQTGRLKSLLSLTVIPYLLSKLEDSLSASRQPVQRSPVNYSYIRFLYDIIVLLNWVLYTWGKSLTHSPILHLLGLKLKHGNADAGPGFSLTKIVEVAAFFIQFLEWWFNNESSQAQSVLSLPIPPPPHSTIMSQNPKLKHGECPLCRQQLKNECVLRVSG